MDSSRTENFEIKHGAIFLDQYKTGVGCVLCDDLDKVCMVAMKPEMLLSDPMEVEFLAIFCGLQLCLPIGINVS